MLGETNRRNCPALPLWAVPAGVRLAHGCLVVAAGGGQFRLQHRLQRIRIATPLLGCPDGAAGCVEGGDVQRYPEHVHCGQVALPGIVEFHGVESDGRGVRAWGGGRRRCQRRDIGFVGVPVRDVEPARVQPGQLDRGSLGQFHRRCHRLDSPGLVRLLNATLGEDPDGAVGDGLLVVDQGVVHNGDGQAAAVRRGGLR